MYKDISFWRYLLGGFIVLLPAAYLENQNPKWAWQYVALILLMVIVFHSDGLQGLMSFVTSELGATRT